MKLADKVGIGALSMRRLGQELGVEAMSLYGHVKNKDEILDGIVDLVVEEIELPTRGTWKSRMRRRALATRETLLRHPWAAVLMESRSNAGPARLAHIEWVLATLRRAGFSVAMAHRAFLAIDSHIYGFVQQELSWPFDSPAELQGMAQELVARLSEDEYPYLREMIDERFGQLDPGDALEFTFGLNLILDALEQYVE